MQQLVEKCWEEPYITLQEICRRRTEEEARKQLLFYHCGSHLDDTKRHMQKLLKVTGLDNRAENLLLGELIISAHDLCNPYGASSANLKRSRQPGVNEKRSQELFWELAEQVNQNSVHPIPEEHLEIVAQGIMVTATDFDPKRGLIQPGIYRDNARLERLGFPSLACDHQFHPVAVFMAMVDTTTAIGMDAPNRMSERVAGPLFFEERPQMLEGILKLRRSNSGFDELLLSPKEEQRKEALQWLLWIEEWTAFQVKFATHCRDNLFPRQLCELDPALRGAAASVFTCFDASIRWSEREQWERDGHIRYLRGESLSRIVINKTWQALLNCLGLEAVLKRVDQNHIRIISTDHLSRQF